MQEPAITPTALVAAAFAQDQATDRLAARWPNLILVHASWLNQIEIYFSILGRKALRPAHFHSLEELKDRILGFQQHYKQNAEPFEWTFTRAKLLDLTRRLQADGRFAAAA